MEQKIAQEGPATLTEAWNQGLQNGLELNEARRKMREIVARRLHELRNEKRMTQQELGIKVNINHLTYRGYENCRSDIPLPYLMRLADFFDVSLDYLVGRTNEKNNSSQSKQEEKANSVEARIAQLEKMVMELKGEAK